ncbi:MAG: hypothetical protein HY081_00795 [Gammaproteobacteria bacterium]|nr:hypothetical protein [Gammaproteobacteria bacterium]
MEMQTGSWQHSPPLALLHAGQHDAQDSRLALNTDLSLICHDGVVVYHRSVAGLDLVEIEFPEAA